MHTIPPQFQTDHHSQLGCCLMPMPQYSPAPSPPQSVYSAYNSPSPADLEFSISSEIDIVKHQAQYQTPLPIYSPSICPNIVQSYPTSKTRPAKFKVPSSVKQTAIAHPYARLFAKKDEVKRRKIWNHALEKSIFDARELSSMGAPQRRTIYISSLEAHIDKLHAQLLDAGFWPVTFEKLAPFKGLNSKTAKSMVAGLQHDASVSKLKLLELERANSDLEKMCSETEC